MHKNRNDTQIVLYNMSLLNMAKITYKNTEISHS